MAVESHGIFQFPDFDDELFEENLERRQIEVDKTYIPENSIYGDFGTELSFDSKNGPLSMQKEIEYSYYRRDWKRVLNLSENWILENNKLIEKDRYKSTEVLLINMRVYLKLGRHAEALCLIPSFSDGNAKETSTMYLFSTVYKFNGMHLEAIELLVKCLTVRHSDYKAWREIGHNFKALADFNGNGDLIVWSVAAFFIASLLISRYPHPESALVNVFKPKELSMLRSYIESGLKECIEMDLDIATLLKSEISLIAGNQLLSWIRDQGLLSLDGKIEMNPIK